MTTRAIHIAGFPVRVGSLYRQRCAWCEVVLIDGDTSCEAVAPSDDGAAQVARSLLFWETGGLVEVISGGGVTQTTIVPHTDGDPLPALSCPFPPRKLEVVRG
jgi:hypothetical protein